MNLISDVIETAIFPESIVFRYQTVKSAALFYLKQLYRTHRALKAEMISQS